MKYNHDTHTFMNFIHHISDCQQKMKYG